MLPYPLQGHVIPFTNLAIKLASNGFTITFINTESIHHQISKAKGRPVGQDVFSEARKSGLDIRYATVSDGFPVGFDRSGNHDQFFEGILHVFSAHVDEIVGNLVREDPTINSIIVDTFYVWGSVIADKYELVNISFFTEPALVFTLYYHVELLRKNGHFASRENRADAIDYIPGVKSIMPSDLMSYFQDKDDISTIVHQIIHKAFEDVKKADFIICNTIQEFEEETVSSLHQKQPFYSIGPIFAPGFTKSCAFTSLWSESDCNQWLNAKPNGSVLYVSFGSYAHTTKHEIDEVANGLLLSGVNFIWVLRPDIVSSDETDILPIGYEDRVKDRGLVVPWCCQVEVISHPAVGGFLTHCGWNSILESIRCGVPLICYPLLTDQFTNRKLVVDDLKIGINLCDKKSILSRNGVLEKINYLMGGKKSEEIKEQVKKVREILDDAMATDGSSVANFNRFVKDLETKIAEIKKD
ncbi:UDP-glycosyltransferase 86A1 [Sesamum alatum]|uniref:Glycosyltransferase n=1 Tax=Sesamum alatum TaxID=300844 RepID=A0AAE1YLI7_9LAMI|nr:UDP-glycosyltransferase 86A1 [Sesamum alatum]